MHLYLLVGITFANKSKFIQVDAAISLAAAGQLLGRCFSEQEKGNESRWIFPKGTPWETETNDETKKLGGKDEREQKTRKRMTKGGKQ